MKRQRSQPFEENQLNQNGARNGGEDQGLSTPAQVQRKTIPEPDAEQPSLEELLKECLQAQDNALWTEFVRRSQPVITAVVIKTVRRWLKPRPDLVDDLVQDTYLKLCGNDFKALRQFVPQHANALLGFLKVVASNTVQDYFRGTYAQKRGDGMEEVPLDQIESAASYDAAMDFERSILVHEIDRYLRLALSSSAYTRDRAIFWLYYKQGLSAKAIAGIRTIGLSVKGVESTIGRMVRVVRQKMNEEAA
jgi:RNA polymerase sigma factor (sigma-70 family)